MKKILLILAVFILTLPSSAESIFSGGWAASFEPVSDAAELKALRTASAADGSVYVSSTYNKAFTFAGKEVADPEGLTSACIAKYNGNGEEQWVVTMEGGALVYALDTDEDGTLYAAGNFMDVVKYTGTDGTTGELAGGADVYTAFVAKISKDGTIEGIKTFAPVVNSAIMESFMYFPEPGYVYVTPNNIKIDGEKVYVSATYTADVEELGWKATYLNVFDFMYMENKSAGIFSLNKNDLSNPASVATVQNTENISYNQYYAEALNFAAENGKVYVGFFGFGNLTLSTPAGKKDFAFEVTTDESGNKEHAFVLATVGNDVTAKVFNVEAHAKDAKPYNLFMENDGENLIIGGTFFGQLPFDTAKNSGEFASDVFMASLKKADASVNWTMTGAKEAEAICMSTYKENTIMATTANETVEIANANGETITTKEQTLSDVDAYSPTNKSAVYCAETKVYVRGQFDPSGSAIDDIKDSSLQKEEGATYNLSGQKVAKNYKGIVIKNGKKYLVK